MIKRNYISVAVVIAVFIGIQFWQTRSLPSGKPPLIFGKELLSGNPKTVPETRDDVQILYFFAPWCGVCKMSSQNAETITRWISGVRVTFVGLDYDSPEEVATFVSDNHLTSSVVLGDASVGRDWNVQGYPTYAVINNRGEISSLSVGYSTLLGTYVRVLLAKLGV